jgi:SAM-dependent methyltransferase
MPYTSLDHFIARQRFEAAYPHIRSNSRVCDLGCGVAPFFLDFAAEKIAYGVGIDDQVGSALIGRWRCIRADLRSGLPLESALFDHVVMLAVLEHLVDPKPVLCEAHRILAPGGTLILTWPSSLVDPVLAAMRALRLISAEMESDEHQKRIPLNTLQQMLGSVGFHGFWHRRFQCGLNNLLVASR